jgi:hypothetical protein
MSRKVFDKLTSLGGVALVVVLLVAGGLLAWGHSYTNSSVRNQLVGQQIYFPTAAVLKTATRNNTGEIQARMLPYLDQYAGQQVLTGAQAEAYADHFIAYHLAVMPYGGVYSKVSGALMAAKPGSANAASLATLQDTVFKGTTLRGLLLEAYGFSKIGSIMLFGAIASFIGAAILALLVALGFSHASRTAEEEKLFARAGLLVEEPTPVA